VSGDNHIHAEYGTNEINRYKHEKLTKEGVEEVVESYKRMNWWP
jgi:hypothetical protein